MVRVLAESNVQKGLITSAPGLEVVINLRLFFSFNPFYWLLINLQMCSAFCYLNKTPFIVPQAMIPSIVFPSTLPSASGQSWNGFLWSHPMAGTSLSLHHPQALCRTYLSDYQHLCEILSSLGLCDYAFWFLGKVPQNSFKIVSLWVLS